MQDLGQQKSLEVFKTLNIASGGEVSEFDSSRKTSEWARALHKPTVSEIQELV